MYKKWTFHILCGALFSFLVCSGIGLATSTSDSTKVTMDGNACADTIRKLEARIQNQPHDAETQFRLGICYTRRGKHPQAHKAFAMAFRSNPAYGNRVAREYMEAGNEQLREGQIRQSRILFQKAIEYDLHLKTEIANEAFQQGKRLFDRGVYDLADERFAVANAMDDSYRARICDMYFTLGSSVDHKRCLELYRIASWYCSHHNEEIGLRLLDIAKHHSSKEWTEIFKAEAAKYVSDDTIKTVFPAPSWKTVHASAYEGKGFDAVDSPQYHIRTVQFGKDVQDGDKIVVVTEGAFKIWDAGWDQCESQCEIIAKNRTPGNYFFIEGPKGKKTIVKVQRYY